jgi:hypothetical protein
MTIFISQDGSVRDFDRNYSLLSPFVCDAVATKKDKRRQPPSSSGDAPMDESKSDPSMSQPKLKDEPTDGKITTVR